MFENWPDNIIPDDEAKFLKLAQDTIDYYVGRWHTNREKARFYFRKLKNSYNGIMDEAIVKRIDNMYGIPNRVKYKDFRLSKNKVDILTGEFLLRPIKSIPQIISPEAVSERQHQIDLMLGLFYAKNTIQELKDNGLDITGGLPIPNSEQEAIEMGSYKHKAEIFYELLLKWLFKEFPTKESLFTGLQNMIFTSECFAQIKIDSSGHPIIETFNPEDAIFEEVPNDPFLSKTPVFGRRIPMTKNMIMKSFNLTKEERETINDWFGGSNAFDFMETNNDNNVNDKLCNVYHIEFKMFKLWTLKEETRNGKYRMSDLSHNWVYNNKNTIKRDVKAGRYSADIKLKEHTFEIYRIGNTIYKDFRMVQNQPVSMTKPADSHYTYTGLLFNTVNNTRVPFYAIMEEAKEQYNLARYMINRELGKFKGVQFGYNRALLPSVKGKPVNMAEILWKMVNDGFIDYSSVAEHNYTGKDLQITDFFKPTDLSLTNSMQQLIMIAQDLERLIDRISGVNDNREGQTSASETATNATNNIISSRTITEPLMFFYDRFIENTLKRYIAFASQVYSKKPELIREFAGDKAAMFIESSEDISVYDIGLYIENTREMQDIRNRVQKYIDTSINAGQMAIPEAFEAEIATTVSEAKALLRKGWVAMQKIQEENQKRQIEADKEIESARLDQEIQAREDAQQHDLDKGAQKGIMKTADNAQKAAIKRKENRFNTKKK